jgi:hypothetical protein
MAAGRWHPAEEQPIATDTTVRVTRHTLTPQKPCDACIGALEKRAPVVPPATCEGLAALNLPAPERRAWVEDLIGSSGVVLFLKGRIGCFRP